MKTTIYSNIKSSDFQPTKTSQMTLSNINFKKVSNIKFVVMLLMCGWIILGLSACNFSNSHEHSEEEIHDHDDHSDDAPIFYTYLNPEQVKAIELNTGTLERRNLTATLSATGALKVPNNHIGLATSSFGGVVKTLHVQSGNIIKKGQVVGTISNPDFLISQEEYLTIKTKIILAEQELQRQTELMEGNAGAMKNLQNATSEVNSLKIRKSALEQQLALMGIDPNTINDSNLRSVLSIKSPVNGSVSNVFAKIGSYVDPMTPLAEIIDNGTLHVDLHVFEKDVGHIRTGQIIYFKITNNPIKEFKAKVFSIGTSFEDDSKTIAVHCDVLGDKAGLIHGTNITATINIDDELQQSVPNEAVVESDGRDYIFIIIDKIPGESEVVNDDPQLTKFQKIEIVKGVTHNGYTGVTFLNPLPENIKVVTKGSFFINAKMVNTGEDGHDH